MTEIDFKNIDTFATRFREKYEINHKSADFKSLIAQRGILLEKRYPPMEVKLLKGSEEKERKSRYDSLPQPVAKPRRAVLSIDGGGIRGILPCLILAEIEHRSHQPIARLFSVLAGTSTGAILSAGFSAPKSDHKHYSADELLELYTSKREKIFKRKNVFKIFTEKYEESGLEDELNNYFGENKLTDCKTDLLVTSTEVKSRQLCQFTTAAAQADSRKNFHLKHILRASSAAPTFFKKFSLHGKIYVDGGMRANNPAQLALHYTERRFEITAKDILLLSLGTGDYIPDPIEPYKNFSLLFWANPKHLSNIYSERLEHEVHNNMCHLFAHASGQYRRLQPMMDRTVPLDASSLEDMQYLLDVADEYVEELDAGSSNVLNKTVESLTTSFYM